MRKISDVKNGERIKVNVSGFIVDAICLNNMPSERKMFLRLCFKSGQQSDGVELYSDMTFMNFNVLNNIQPNQLTDKK